MLHIKSQQQAKEVRKTFVYWSLHWTLISFCRSEMFVTYIIGGILHLLFLDFSFTLKKNLVQKLTLNNKSPPA